VKKALITISIAAIACGRAGGENHFRLSVAGSGSSSNGIAQPLEIQAGETLTLQLLVVGSVPDAVAFTTSNLPPFATLKGVLLTLAPGRPDAGTFDFTITATSSGESAVAAIHLVVSRYNSPPAWDEAVPVHFRDQSGWRWPGICPSSGQEHGSYCTVVGVPAISFWACDEERDVMVGEIEVVVKGQPFTGVATQSLRSSGSQERCSEFVFALEGLAPEQSYDFAIRTSDVYGAFAVPKSISPLGSTGWYRNGGWTFDQGPCTTKSCAGVPAGWWCSADADCLSRSCDTTRGPINTYRCR